MRDRVTVVTLCLCGTFFILEKVPFSGLKLASVRDDLSPLNVALFFYKIEAILEKKRVELRP